MTDTSFNPVVGFLTVSTPSSPRGCPDRRRCFNPVVGFLTVSTPTRPSVPTPTAGFNPVVGFLTVSTQSMHGTTTRVFEFQSRRGFSDRLDWPQRLVRARCLPGFNPVVGFLTVSTGGDNSAIGGINVSPGSKMATKFVDGGCTRV